MATMNDKRAVFALGTGRCGTKFLYRALAHEPDIASWHERHPLSDTFHRYCQWYNLAVDQAGFLATKAQGLADDWQRHAVSFESSAYLSLSVPQLYERFGARFILLVRRPDEVVTSCLTKGWYQPPLLRDEPTLAVGYQPAPHAPHHPFSRLAPTGDLGRQWATWSRVGQLAWYWSALNRAALDLLAALPAEAYRVVRLEDLTYETYCELVAFMGLAPQMTADVFAKLAAQRPNRLRHHHSIHDWSAQSWTEFVNCVRPLAEYFHYEYHPDILKQLTRPPVHTPPAWHERLKGHGRHLWKRLKMR